MLFIKSNFFHYKNYFPVVQICFYTFKSALSLETLYPDSSKYDQFATAKMETSNIEQFTGHIPIDQLKITYCKSSGPGGQNVGKTNTKVDIRFHVASAKWLSDDIKDKILAHYKSSINREGFFIIKSDKTRYQLMNQADALMKLRNLIWKVGEETNIHYEENEETFRKRHERAARQRLKEKRMRSVIKMNRSLLSTEE